MQNPNMNRLHENIDHLADAAITGADHAIAATQRTANDALDAAQDKVTGLRDSANGAMARAAAQVDDITRRGVERAKEATAEVRHQVSRAGERTVVYIQDEPVKSVLIALAAGAALAALLGALRSSSHTHR